VELKRIFILLTASIILGLILGKILAYIYITPHKVKWALEPNTAMEDIKNEKDN